MSLTRTYKIDPYANAPENNRPVKQTRLGIFIPNPVQPRDFHTEETAAAVVEVNAKLAKLAQAKASLENDNYCFKCTDAVDLTDAQIKSHGKVHDRALGLFQDAMKITAATIDVLKLAKADALAYAEVCQAEVHRLQADWLKKMIDSGHYADRKYDSSLAGGVIGWFGEAHNSLLIAAAIGEHATAATIAPGLQQTIFELERGIQHNAAAIRDSRSALAAF